MDLSPQPARVIIASLVASDTWHLSCPHGGRGSAWHMLKERGAPFCPSVCVDLSANHTHDLLLDFRVLSIDVGISDLAVLVPVAGDKKEGFSMPGHATGDKLPSAEHLDLWRE